jgi:hypothetical protein
MAGCGPVDLSSNLSPCSLIFQVIALLESKSLTQKQIITATGFTDRAIRYVLSKLLKDRIILQRASLFDARQKYYEVVK